MNMTSKDCLKKAILDTQERVRDFMNYSEQVEDQGLSSYFKECAETEGKQAHRLKEFLNSIG